MILRLLRHGMTAANEKRLYCGFTDLPLSERGIGELRLIRDEAASRRFLLYATSGLKRAVSTMEIILGRKPDTVLPGFKEMNFGSFEMKSHEELKNEPDYIRWIDGGENVCCPGGESRAAFRKRVISQLEELTILNCDAVVVCHGGVIVTIMDKLFPAERNFYEWQPAFGKGYTVEFCENKAASWRE